MNPIASAILARGLGTGSTKTGKNRQMSQSLSLNLYSLTRSRQNGQSRSQRRSLCSSNRSRQNGQNRSQSLCSLSRSGQNRSQNRSQSRSQSLCSLNRSRQSGYPLNRRRGRVSTSLNTSNESEIRTTLFVAKVMRFTRFRTIGSLPRSCSPRNSFPAALYRSMQKNTTREEECS
jgi:hypothetical protein